MKKIIAASVAALAAGSIAMAADGAALYKTCIACHGPDASKIPPGATAESVLTDKSADQMFEALKGYKAGTYGGKMKMVMKGQTARLSEEDMRALADYIAGL